MKWKLTITERHLVDGHIAEGAREIGILWLVFSMLDRIVTGQLTFAWGITNVVGALAFWGFGIYTDVARHR